MTSSHELRTPIVAIEGALSNMFSPALAHSEERRVGFVHMAYKQARHLGELFRDLEIVNQIVNGERQPQRTPMDVIAIVRQEAEGYAAAAKQKGLHLSITVPAEPIVAFTDAANITEVVTKLLDNALRYTKQGQITVTVDMTTTEVMVRVQDTGIGIAPTDQPKLFKQFSRIHNELTRETSGTGLGLYIAKHLAELGGGSLTVASEVGKGSTLTCTVPRIANSAAHEPITKPAVASVQG